MLEIDDIELELNHEVCDWIDPLVHQAEDLIVAAYLVHDDDPVNPMKEYDAMGELITWSEGVITDGNPWPHLGLLDSPYRGELERDFDCDGVYELAKEILWNDVGADSDFWAFINEEYGPHRAIRDAYDEIDFGKYGDAIPDWLETKWVTAQEAAWDELYEQGKIGTKFAVPVQYCDHGSGTTSIGVCSIDICNAVWIPTKCDYENLGNADHKQVERYAQGCLDEYVRWCNGDAYGCVVEVFSKHEDGSWESVPAHYDSCWGFLGSEYAEEALKTEFFEPMVHTLTKSEEENAA